MKIEGRCSTCVFWRRDAIRPNGHAKCEGIPHDKNGMVDWLDPDVSHYGRPDADWWERERLAEYHTITASPAVTQDGSGYLADLLTTEAFGCTLWERVRPA